MHPAPAGPLLAFGALIKPPRAPLPRAPLGTSLFRRKASFEGRCLEAQLVQPARRPGAGRLVRSGAVGRHRAEEGLAVGIFGDEALCPVLGTIRRDPDAVGDLRFIALVLGAGTYVEDDGRVRAFQLL